MKFYIQTEEINFVHYEVEAKDYHSAVERVRMGEVDPKNIEHEDLSIVEAHEMETIK